MKKSFLLAIFFVSLLCTSCKTTPELYTAFSGSGVQLVFVRAVDFKQINPVIKKASIDVTLHLKKQSLEENPVCNYTITASKNNIAIVDDIDISFVWEDGGELKQISAVKKEQMFKQISGSNVNARFSLEFDKAEFKQMLDSSSPVKVLFVTPNLYNVRFENAEFNKQIDDVRLMMN